MYPLRSLPLLALLLSILVITVLASPTEQRSNGDPEKFQELLSTASEADLHEILHRFEGRFRDGVFTHDRTAMEAVHGEDPAMATELVRLALNKRQVSNTTITSTAPTTTADSPSTPTSDNDGGATPTTTSNVRTSVIPPSAPSDASAVSTSSGAVIYSNSEGQLTTARSSTALVSFRPSTTTLRTTTTLPDGSASVITSVAIVEAPYTTLTDTAIAAESGTSTNSPSLQTGGAIPSSGYLETMMVAMACLAVVATLAI